MRSLRSAMHSLTRRSELALVSALSEQIAITHEGLRIAVATISGELASAEARERMNQVEHRGDDERARAVAILSSSLASPIDREDLFRVSRSIDDVLDNLRDFVREHDLFDVGPQLILLDVLDAVGQGLDHLAEAVLAVSANPSGIRDATLSVRKSAIRPRYQRAMAELLSGEVTGQTLKTRELLRRLDVVGLRLGEAADALADGAMKRSH
jgi:hypothetical protein